MVLRAPLCCPFLCTIFPGSNVGSCNGLQYFRIYASISPWSSTGLQGHLWCLGDLLPPSCSPLAVCAGPLLTPLPSPLPAVRCLPSLLQAAPEVRPSWCPAVGPLEPAGTCWGQHRAALASPHRGQHFSPPAPLLPAPQHLHQEQMQAPNEYLSS